MLENKKDFLGTQEFKKETLLGLIDLAIEMKRDKSKFYKALPNKKLGMIFEKSSTRTRVSFEVGIVELGGTPLFLSSRDIQIGRGEPIKDTAKVLSRYLDAIMIRTFKQSDVEELAREASIPVINGLTDSLHPCQAVADFQTILEKKGQLEGVNLCFIGDGNNVANSLGLLATKVGMNFAIASPKGYQITPDMQKQMRENASKSGSKLLFTDTPKQAVENADVIYTDVWTSMGQEEESQKRLVAFKGYEINTDMVKGAKSDYIFMHCLPAHRGEEVSAEIIDSSHSVIYDEAENRLHAQKAIMLELMK